jgi:hypothetical protein
MNIQDSDLIEVSPGVKTLPGKRRLPLPDAITLPSRSTLNVIMAPEPIIMKKDVKLESDCTINIREITNMHIEKSGDFFKIDFITNKGIISLNNMKSVDMKYDEENNKMIVTDFEGVIEEEYMKDDKGILHKLHT